ncbi:MAG: hypothetical protein U0N15_04900 [Bifidobacterium choerinum]
MRRIHRRGAAKRRRSNVCVETADIERMTGEGRRLHLFSFFHYIFMNAARAATGMRGARKAADAAPAAICRRAPACVDGRDGQ